MKGLISASQPWRNGYELVQYGAVSVGSNTAVSVCDASGDWASWGGHSELHK